MKLNGTLRARSPFNVLQQRPPNGVQVQATVDQDAPTLRKLTSRQQFTCCTKYEGRFDELGRLRINTGTAICARNCSTCQRPKAKWIPDDDEDEELTKGYERQRAHQTPVCEYPPLNLFVGGVSICRSNALLSCSSSTTVALDRAENERYLADQWNAIVSGTGSRRYRD